MSAAPKTTDFLVLAGQQLGEFSDGSGFAGAIDSGDQNHRGAGRGEFERRVRLRAMSAFNFF